jgi:hypothetical protein
MSRLSRQQSSRNVRYHARIDYPVQTINAGECQRFYQTDTGPVLLRDLTREPEDLANGIHLAFAAFNCPEWTEFRVRKRTRRQRSLGASLLQAGQNGRD